MLAPRSWASSRRQPDPVSPFLCQLFSPAVRTLAPELGGLTVGVVAAGDPVAGALVGSNGAGLGKS